LNPRHLAPGVAAFVTALLVALLGLRAGAEPPTTRDGQVRLRLLGVNDLHGHLEPLTPDLGGVAWLKSHLDRASLAGRTIRVHAGDMVGASPLISSHWHDEPTIEAANEIGFDVGTVGNHEFDEGGDEMLRLVRRARFPYVSANVFDLRHDLVLPPYQVVERAGVRVGFIGATTPSTPRWLLKRHSERYRFTDISDAVNRWVPVLRRRGVEAIVVLAHEGAPTQVGVDGAKATGPVVDETRQMSDAVDVVVAGHSHSRLNLRVGHKLVVEALSYGAAFDSVEMTVDRSTGDVVSKSARLPETRHAGVPPDPELGALVASYAARIAPLAGRIVGHSEGALTRGGPLERVAADAQRALAGTDLALVTTSSLRDDLPAGRITYADASQAQSYDHPVMRMEMSGHDLLELLEGQGRALYVSGRRPLDPAATYSVAASELIATGDWYPILRDRSRAKRIVGTEVEALVSWLER
jgi:5'-nucleotidase